VDMTGNGDLRKSYANSQTRRCRARDPTDALNLELAKRLNDWSAGSERNADHNKPLDSVLTKLFCWSLLAAAVAIASLWLLT
jgi:hypothetical protein